MPKEIHESRFYLALFCERPMKWNEIFSCLCTSSCLDKFPFNMFTTIAEILLNMSFHLCIEPSRSRQSFPLCGFWGSYLAIHHYCSFALMCFTICLFFPLACGSPHARGLKSCCAKKMSLTLWQTSCHTSYMRMVSLLCVVVNLFSH